MFSAIWPQTCAINICDLFELQIIAQKRIKQVQISFMTQLNITSHYDDNVDEQDNISHDANRISKQEGFQSSKEFLFRLKFLFTAFLHKQADYNVTIKQ